MIRQLARLARRFVRATKHTGFFQEKQLKEGLRAGYLLEV